MANDIIPETPEVTEALRRLPKKMQDERNFRFVRAFKLSASHQILPKEEWTKFEEDVKYLEPYLDEVQREIDESEEWSKAKWM